MKKRQLQKRFAETETATTVERQIRKGGQGITRKEIQVHKARQNEK